MLQEFSPYSHRPFRNQIVDIVFGRPSRDCDGYGVCRLELSQRPAMGCAGRRVRAGLYYSRKKRELQFRVCFASVSEALFTEQFGSGYFRAEEHCPLDPQVCRLLGLPLKSVLLPGRYPYQVNGPVLEFRMEVASSGHPVTITIDSDLLTTITQ